MSVSSGDRRRAADRDGHVVAWQAGPLLDLRHKARRGALADGVAVGEGRAPVRLHTYEKGEVFLGRPACGRR